MHKKPPAASRTIIWPLVKQIRLLLVPLSHDLLRRFAVESRLRQLVVVQGHIAQQGLLHVRAAVESVSSQNVCNAAIKSLHHPVGSGRPGPGQSVLYAQLLAQLIELMAAAGSASPASKQPVRIFLAAIGPKLSDPGRTGLVPRAQKGVRTGGCWT